MLAYALRLLYPEGLHHHLKQTVAFVIHDYIEAIPSKDVMQACNFAFKSFKTINHTLYNSRLTHKSRDSYRPNFT